jgi:hypothetical protein
MNHIKVEINFLFTRNPKQMGLLKVLLLHECPFGASGVTDFIDRSGL